MSGPDLSKLSPHEKERLKHTLNPQLTPAQEAGKRRRIAELLGYDTSKPEEEHRWFVPVTMERKSN
jgi:hypothetical protein